jgi:hypothetical protein
VTTVVAASLGRDVLHRISEYHQAGLRNEREGNYASVCPGAVVFVFVLVLGIRAPRKTAAFYAAVPPALLAGALRIMMNVNLVTADSGFERVRLQLLKRDKFER